VPDRGLLDPAAITAAPLGGKFAAPWTMNDARWCQVTFEVAQQAALESLPGDVSRPVPCYARIFVLEAKDGPAGPFKLATLMTGGRFRMLPRNVLVEGVVEGPLGAVTAAFGAPFGAGTISIERSDGVICASVKSGEELVASLTLPEARAIDPAMLRWDAWLGFAGPGDNIDLVEYGPQPEIRAAFLSKGACIETPGSLPATNMWRRFRNLNTISACYAEGGMTFTAPEVQQALV
jgi:hypothetical protein